MSRKVFDYYTARLEAAKRQNFPPETLNVWYSLFIRYGWDDRKMVQRYFALLEMEQVRRDITIDDWLHAKPARRQQEVWDDALKIAQRILDNKKKKMEEMSIPTTEIIRAGYADLAATYAQEFELVKEDILLRLEARARIARKYIGGLTDDQAMSLHSDLVKAGMIKPIEDVLLRDRALRIYLRTMIPPPMRGGYMARASMQAAEIIQRSVQPYLQSEVLAYLVAIESQMQKGAKK